MTPEEALRKSIEAHRAIAEASKAAAQDVADQRQAAQQKAIAEAQLTPPVQPAAS